jgi:hypothetical protein
MVQVIEIGKKVKHTMPAEQRTALIKKCRDEDEKMIHGQFEFLDAVGGFFEFSYRKYPGQPLTIIKLIHGETCDLPRGAMKQINGSVQKIRRYDLNMPFEGGKPPRTFTTKSRVRFTPSDYL